MPGSNRVPDPRRTCSYAALTERLQVAMPVARQDEGIREGQDRSGLGIGTPPLNGRCCSSSAGRAADRKVTSPIARVGARPAPCPCRRALIHRQDVEVVQRARGPDGLDLVGGKREFLGYQGARAPLRPYAVRPPASAPRSPPRAASVPSRACACWPYCANDHQMPREPGAPKTSVPMRSRPIGTHSR